MTPIYELVTAAELKVGDEYQVDANLPSIEVDRIIKGSGIVTVYRSSAHNLLDPVSLPSHLKVFRRLPATDDPRVLRRASEIMSRWYAAEAASDAKIELDGAIGLARQELESEA
jgi:hypothetical protein